MFDTFWGLWRRPLNGCIAVILDFSPIVCFWDYDFMGAMIRGLEFCGALVGCHDFLFTGTEGFLILTDLFPWNWSAIAVDEKTRERGKFEQFKRSAFFDCNTKLITPIGVAEGCKLVAFWRGRRRCDDVGNDWMLVFLKRTLSVNIWHIHLYL